MNHFRKTLSILSILSVLLSLLLVQRAFAPPPPSVHHNHQERYENPRENSYPVWFNLSIDVWGYFDQSQAYYRTNHSITFDQKEGNITINDFRILIHNLTYYGLGLNGEIVYSYTILVNSSAITYENSTFYEEEGVYSAFTYVNCSVNDRIYNANFPPTPEWYNFTLTAGVSRRNDVAVTSVGASPKEVFPDEKVSITVYVANQGAVNETFNVTTYCNDTVIGTQTVPDLSPGIWTPLTFNWDTSDVKPGDYRIKAHASVVPGEWNTADNTKLNGTVTILTVTIWYMQSDKWFGSSYYKLYWNNTIASTYKTVCKFQYCLYGDLGVKIYKGTTCISGADPITWNGTATVV